MNRILVIFLLFNATYSLCQTNRYVAYFSSKVDTGYPYSLERPEEFLTKNSIDRRIDQDIKLDSSDLPVNPSYIDQLNRLGARVYFTSRWMNAAIIQMDSTLCPSINDLMFVDSLFLVAEGPRLKDRIIEWQEPVRFDSLKNVGATTDLQLAMLQVTKMHEEKVYGQGVRMAILDDGFTGVDRLIPFKHLWENNQIVGFKDFVENESHVFRLGDHGTNVFSTISAKYDTIFTGIAPEAEFILCITEEGGSEDRVEEFNWLVGAEFADSLGAEIINSSLGYRRFDIPEHHYYYKDLDGKSSIISQAARLALEKGIVVVVSAGNEGANGPRKWKYINPPADTPGILSVGSVNANFSSSKFSSRGPTSDGRIKPDVSALGYGTSVIYGDGTISFGVGTSFASPLIAGLAAGTIQRFPELTAKEVIDAIKNSAHRAQKPDTLMGFGVPSYLYLNGKYVILDDIINEEIGIYPNPFKGDQISFLSSGLEKEASLEIIDAAGTTILKDKIKPHKESRTFDFSLDSLKEGVYYLFLQSGDVKRVTKLIHF